MGLGGAVGQHDLGLPDDRHHDGFCIWPTKTGRQAWGRHRIRRRMRAYVNSFRGAGLRVGLYYSILSLRDDIRHFNITSAKVKLIKDQLTELLNGYGEVDILITDGWDAPWSRITYEEVPFQEIYEHIKNLQPNCLLCDLNASQYPAGGLYYSDVKALSRMPDRSSGRQRRAGPFLCDPYRWLVLEAAGHEWNSQGGDDRGGRVASTAESQTLQLDSECSPDPWCKNHGSYLRTVSTNQRQAPVPQGD